MIVEGFGKLLSIHKAIRRFSYVIRGIVSFPSDLIVKLTVEELGIKDFLDFPFECIVD